MCENNSLNMVSTVLMYIQGLTQEAGSGTFLEVLPNMKTVICYYLYYLDSQDSLPWYHHGIMHKTAHVQEHGQLYHPYPTQGVGSRLTIWGGGGVWLDFLATECGHT